jgi:hypothetical protein
MKTFNLKSLLWVCGIAMLLLWSQCNPPTLDSVDHPYEVKPSDTVSIPISISRGWDMDELSLYGYNPSWVNKVLNLHKQKKDTLGNYIWFGMEMPSDWSVIDSFIYVAYDSIPASIIDSGYFVYSDYHVDFLNDTFPNPPGYKWMAWQTTDTMLMEEGKMWFDPRLVTGEEPGYFHLKYVSGWNSNFAESGFQEPLLTISGAMNDTCWVTTTEDTGEGSLRYAAYNTRHGGNIMFALEPSDTIQLESSINIYREININKYPGAGHLINIQGPSGGNAINIMNTDDFIFGTTKLNMNGLNIFNSGGAGVFAYDINRVTIQNSEMHDNHGPGIQLKYESNTGYHTADVYRCNAFNNQSSGMYFQGIGNEQFIVNVSQSHIYNNTAARGGGIYAKDCNLNLTLGDFVIENNTSELGGGIFYEGWESDISESVMHISDVTIRNNVASIGGGIYTASGIIETEDDQSNRSNVYLNQADRASDIYYSTAEEFTIYLDTFSVLHPTCDYLTAIDNSLLTPYNYSINHGMIEQYSQDLFVSPGGNDDNDGLSWQTAKKTIKGATRVCNPIQPITVYLDSGYFSTDQNGDVFPLYVQPNMNFKGMGQGITFLGPGATVFNVLHDQEIYLSDMTIQGYDKTIICKNASLILDHITLENSYTPGEGRAIAGGHNDIVLNNCTVKSFTYGVWSYGYLYADSCIFTDNDQAALIDIGSSYYDTETPLITNTSFIRNGRGITQCDRLTAHNIVGENNGVAISVDEHLEISNSHFNGNKSGIWFKGDTLMVDGCSFIGNDAYSGDPYSYGYTKGAGIFIGYGNGGPESIYFRLDNSYFGENTAEYGAAFCFGNHSNSNNSIKRTDLKVTNCIFENNFLYPVNGDGSAIHVTLPSADENPMTMDIINCLFTGNHSSISTIYSGKNGPYTYKKWNLNIVNCTLADNDTQFGINISYNDTLTVTNSIIRDNLTEAVHYNNIVPQISYSNIQGGWEGTGNIDANPLFDSLGIHPYQILNESPCVNSGCHDTTGLEIPMYDLGGNYRITGDRIDMGAYECLFTAIPGLSKNINKVSIYPNPVTSTIIMEIELRKPGQVQICLYNQLGQVEQSENKGYKQPGQYLFSMNVSDLLSGVYLLKTILGNDIATYKIVIR